nr:LytTR family DNA-binding domain-containing protein [uncultured Draconibacterium sp.]
MGRFTTLIIDDEQIARQRLKRLLSGFDTIFELIGEARNGEEGLEAINGLKPDLVFLDIQMPGKNGFEMLHELEYVPIIIFCTAYEEYAVKAFETVALDYLIKPVEQERLMLTIDKLKSVESKNMSRKIAELLDFVYENKEPKVLQSIPHKIGDRVILIKPDKITYFEASDKYVDFYTCDGKRYMTEMSLKKLEERLESNFMRVQRGIIVNTNYVSEVRKYFRGKYILIIDDHSRTKIETGRSFGATVRQILE